MQVCKPQFEPENLWIRLVNVLEGSDIEVAHVIDIKLCCHLLPLLENYSKLNSKDINVQKNSFCR